MLVAFIMKVENIALKNTHTLKKSVETGQRFAQPSEMYYLLRITRGN